MVVSLIKTPRILSPVFSITIILMRFAKVLLALLFDSSSSTNSYKLFYVRLEAAHENEGSNSTVTRHGRYA